MSEQDFELYLTLLAKTLHLSDKQQCAISGELRDHLEQRLDELTAQGMSKHEAVQTALAEFGDASALAHDFSQTRKPLNRRRIMQTTFGTLAACAAVTFATMTLAPANFFSGQPTQQAATAQGDARDPQAAPEADAPRRELAIQAVIRDVQAVQADPQRSIHVIDCTQILVPRNDGLDLLDRTASLALAIETTVASVDPNGHDAITVQAFEEFLIVTATVEAFAQAEMLLDQIGAKVQQREAIRDAEDQQRTLRELDKVQVEIERSLNELIVLQQQANEHQMMCDRLLSDGVSPNSPEYRQLLEELEQIQPRIEALTARRMELERLRMQLIPFGGC